ncbi:MAG TPA: DinB family protein [Ktedonobacterales bacterium]|jgi:hypothetical protein
MDDEQTQWVAKLRAISGTFRAAMTMDDDRVMRHRPGPTEWSAVEVLGHMNDKLTMWSERVERIAAEDRPSLPGYDQDALVRDYDYQRADPAVLLASLQRRCDHFADVVAALSPTALDRAGIHSEFGPMTIQRCVEIVLRSAPEHLAQLRAAQASAPAE